MTSVPIAMRLRVAGKSKVKNLRMAFIMLQQILRLWFYMRWQE